MLIEVHMLKNYAPANLNRDDAGAPKSCLFGGVQRGRISSQCLKRSWRKSDIFVRSVGEAHLGVRTRKMPELVGKALAARGVSGELIEVVEKRLSGFGNKEGKENKDGAFTAQIVFYAPEDIEALTALMMEKLEACGMDKKKFEKLSAKELQAAVKDAATRPVSLDIALFGRMVTSNAFADVEAAMQVAHAISTNRLTMESDFFTAMDDMLLGDDTEEIGAGMMGDVDFNSSCYYIYAALDTDKLEENLRHAPQRKAWMECVIPALLRTMAMSNPSGKQNTFAGHALPSAVLVECKNAKVPLSYANAFVAPVAPRRGKDLIENSIRALVEEVQTMDRDYALPVEKRLWFCSSRYDVPMDNAQRCRSFEELVSQLNADGE